MGSEAVSSHYSMLLLNDVIMFFFRKLALFDQSNLPIQLFIQIEIIQIDFSFDFLIFVRAILSKASVALLVNFIHI